MIKMRLRRQGAKGRPSYRIVIAHDQSPRGGKTIEEIGFYDPIANPAIVRLDVDRARYWMSVGAQPSSDTVRHMLRREGILDERNRLVSVPGTLTDPVTRAVEQLIRVTDRELAGSTPRTIEFAGRLAKYARDLSKDYPKDPRNTAELDADLAEWIRQFVARGFSESAIEAAEAEKKSLGMAAAD